MVEVDTSLILGDIQVSNHLVYGRVLRFEAETLHGSLELLGVNEA